MARPQQDITATINPQTDCPLFKLPPELRTLIYEQVLIPRRILGSVMISKHPQDDDDFGPSVLAILETCRQIRNEAEHIFYSINTLAISYMHLPLFVRQVSKPRLDAMTDVKLFVVSGDETIAACFRALPRLRNLRSVVVHCIRLFSFLWDERERDFVKRALGRCVKLESIRICTATFEKRPDCLIKVAEELQGVLEKKNVRLGRKGRAVGW